MCQGEDRALETPGGAGGGKVQALNLREPARVSGSGSGSMVCTQQTGLQEPPGDRPSKAGGEKATAGQQKAEAGGPFEGHDRPGNRINFLNYDVSLHTGNQHTYLPI